jgi:hypothetical protein
VIVVEDEEEAVRFCLHYNPLSPGGASLLNQAESSATLS